jgi:hypothetical protein
MLGLLHGRRDDLGVLQGSAGMGKNNRASTMP